MLVLCFRVLLDVTHRVQVGLGVRVGCYFKTSLKWLTVAMHLIETREGLERD